MTLYQSDHPEEPPGGVSKGNPRGEVPPPVLPRGQGPAAAAHAAGPDFLEKIALNARAQAKRLDDATALFGFAVALGALLWFVTPLIGAQLP